MSLAVATLVATLTAVSAAPGQPSPNSLSKACNAEELMRAGYLPADLKKLDELPPAYHHLTVIRSVGGCSVATIKYQGRVYWQPIPPNLSGRLQPLEKGPAVRR